ncbi:MAG: acetyl-coenzyme A synthetase N-terminal domain-containing protein, partial [Solirubrobacteraceae bacterium]
MASASSIREQPLWTPSEEWRERTEMAAFMHWAGARHDRDLGEYAALWEWSVANLEDFWADIWEFCGIRASHGYERVLAQREMPGARWVPGAQLNYAENLLLGGLPAAGRGAPARGNELAVLHCSELRDLDR